MRVILGAALAGVLLLLAGCGEPTPTPTPTDAASEPVFASEEEALAAAEELFAKYVAASDLMGTSGGNDLSGFEGILTENQLADETDQANDLLAAGKRLVGSNAFFEFRLQQLDQSDPPHVYLQAYLCADLSNVKYVDAQGVETSPSPDAVHLPIEAIFVDAPDEPTRLLIEDVRSWTGENYCS